MNCHITSGEPAHGDVIVFKPLNESQNILHQTHYRTSWRNSHHKRRKHHYKNETHPQGFILTQPYIETPSDDKIEKHSDQMNTTYSAIIAPQVQIHDTGAHFQEKTSPAEHSFDSFRLHKYHISQVNTIKSNSNTIY